MYRVTFFAHKQHHNRIDMSFIRRLIYHGQTLLRTQFFGGPYRQIKISKELKIERIIRVEGGSATRGGIGNAGQFQPPCSGSNVIEWVGKEIHAQFRKVFVGNVLNRVSSNSSESIRKRAIQQLIHGNNSRPFFALVGLSLASGNGILTKSDEFEGLCWEIKTALSKKPLVTEDEGLKCPTNDSENELLAKNFEFGPFIGKGSEAVVYSADYKQQENSPKPHNEETSEVKTKKWPFAIKMMDNYFEASNALSIMLGFKREIVPARKIQLYDLEKILNDGTFGDIKKCPPHPNIIEIHSAFADEKILLPGMENYASALPPRLNSAGLGRNMTLYLVMKNYDTNLERYLYDQKDLNMKTRVYLFVQLLEGLTHLFENSIAHRDLKADNILLNYNSNINYPHLVIGDFGCCLAEKSAGLSIPFSNQEVRGGNPALMPPEIANAKPGSFKRLSYEKADLWSAGAIGYQIFGAENPFYMRGEKGERKYDSRTYEETALPQLPHDVPPILRRLVKNLLRKNPSQRVNADVSATICHLYLWGPTMWLRREKEKPSNSEVMQWLLTLTTKVLCQWNGPRIQAELEFEIIRVFLNRLRFGIVRNALDWIYQEE